MNISVYLSKLFLRLFILTFITTTHIHAENIVKNSNFEIMKDENIDSWRFEGWEINPKLTTHQAIVDNDPHLLISSSEDTHAYMLQDVWLDQDSNYVFTGDIKSINIPAESAGASISLKSTHRKGCNVNGNSDWTQCQLQISNNGPRKKVTLMLSLGHYGSLNKGQAFFKNITLEKKQNTLTNMPTITFGKSQKHLKKTYFTPPQDVYLNIALVTLMLSLFISLFILIKKSPTES